jgi:hypothetical protein
MDIDRRELKGIPRMLTTKRGEKVLIACCEHSEIVTPDLSGLQTLRLAL